MKPVRGDECQLAVDLIESQLRALAVSISLASQAALPGTMDADGAACFRMLRRKRRLHDTGSGGNMVTGDHQDDVVSASGNRVPPLSVAPDDDYLRILVGNALLVVRLFLIEHALGNMRTPEIQFLGHACDAIFNGNRFDLDPGYMPIATFDGLAIDALLSGTPLFGDARTEGFMELGDAIALLQWLSHFFSGERHFVTGGDAG